MKFVDISRYKNMKKLSMSATQTNIAFVSKEDFDDFKSKFETMSSVYYTTRYHDSVYILIPDAEIIKEYAPAEDVSKSTYYDTLPYRFELKHGKTKHLDKLGLRLLKLQNLIDE